MPHDLATPDFARAWLTWTSTRVHHSPRMQVLATCRIITATQEQVYYLSAACAGENMYAPSGLIQTPPYDFIMVYSPAGEYYFAKSWADRARNLLEVHRVGEAMSTHDGRGAPLVAMSAQLPLLAAAVPLYDYASIRAAILGYARLNGRTEITAPDGATRVILDYPLSTCNISHATEQWQVDAGPVLLPDPAALAAGLAALRPGYLVYHAWDWVELCRQAILPSDPAAAGSRYSPPQRLSVRNTLFRLPD